jgi:hypothetical protein
MQRLFRSLIIGVGLSAVFFIASVALARFWGAPLSVYFAPGSITDHPYIGSPLGYLVRLVVPEGGPPAALLLIAGTSFVGWLLAFALMSYVLSAWRQRGV